MVRKGWSINYQLGNAPISTLNGAIVHETHNQCITHAHDLICNSCNKTLLVNDSWRCFSNVLFLNRNVHIVHVFHKGDIACIPFRSGFLQILGWSHARSVVGRIVETKRWNVTSLLQFNYRLLLPMNTHFVWGNQVEATEWLIQNDFCLYTGRILCHRTIDDDSMEICTEGVIMSTSSCRWVNSFITWKRTI